MTDEHPNSRGDETIRKASRLKKCNCKHRASRCPSLDCIDLPPAPPLEPKERTEAKP